MKKISSLILGLFIVGSILITCEKASSQSPTPSLCETSGIKEEGTGMVYCLGLGSSTCVVPCPPSGGGGPKPILTDK